MTSAAARQAGPWDALLHPATRGRVNTSWTMSPAERTGTKLARLLDELARRQSATTLTLSVCTDLTSRQVWGLLKAPRAWGQVRFEGGRWSLANDFAGRDVERAAALLRDRGWRVVPPNAANKPPAGGGSA